MVARMIIRSRPRVFRPESPLRRTSMGESAIMAREIKERRSQWEKKKRRDGSRPAQEAEVGREVG